ncbi:MAG TPA: nuclear transport factor 2 family protein [Vicinamibacteria bacterium]|nr:nuclear transport factor 2 family protein [Vicinamibacteria bacterium]
MMRKNTIGLSTLALVLCTVLRVGAAEVAGDVSAAVLGRDAAFWKAYNACDVKGMAEFFTEDVEFYHDRGGTTLGHPAFVAALRDDLCGSRDSSLRREAVDGTVHVFPMKKNDAVYGAILVGEHVFYVKPKGKTEFLDGRAKFTHLWTLKDGVWKMSRIFSYDHGPAVR